MWNIIRFQHTYEIILTRVAFRTLHLVGTWVEPVTRSHYSDIRHLGEFS